MNLTISMPAGARLNLHAARRAADAAVHDRGKRALVPGCQLAPVAALAGHREPGDRGLLQRHLHAIHALLGAARQYTRRQGLPANVHPGQRHTHRLLVQVSDADLLCHCAVAHPAAVPLPSLAPHRPYLRCCGGLPIWCSSSAGALWNARHPCSSNCAKLPRCGVLPPCGILAGVCCWPAAAVHALQVGGSKPSSIPAREGSACEVLAEYVWLRASHAASAGVNASVIGSVGCDAMQRGALSVVR